MFILEFYCRNNNNPDFCREHFKAIKEIWNTIKKHFVQFVHFIVQIVQQITSEWRESLKNCNIFSDSEKKCPWPLCYKVKLDSAASVF